MSLRPCMATRGLAAFLKPGLQALGTHSLLVSVEKPSKSIESIDLDSSLKKTHGQDSRWDYGVEIQYGSDRHIAWIEVHPANPGEVDSILKKLAWLKAFLRAPACQCSRSFHWIATGSVTIDPKRTRRLSSAGITSPRKKLIFKETR